MNIKFSKFILLIVIHLLLLSVPSFSQDSLNIQVVSSCLERWESAGDLYIVDEYVYVVGSYSGFRIVDISDPFHPFEVGWCDYGGFTHDLKIRDSYAYVTIDGSGFDDIDSGLYIYDILNPQNCIEIGSYIIDDWNYGIELDGDYAYVSNDESGVIVLDISDPENPIEVASIMVIDQAGKVSIHENTLFLSAIWEGLWLIDISDPFNPVEIIHIDTPGFARDVFVNESILYVADDFAGMHIYDISNLENPTLISTYPIQSSLKSFCISDTIAYLPDRGTGEFILNIVSVADPENPFEISRLAGIRGHGDGVAVSENHVYLGAREDGGLRVVDISNINFPVEISYYGPNNDKDGIAIIDNFALVTVDTDLRIVNISNLLNPLPVVFHEIPGQPYKIDTYGDYAYIASGEEHICIIDILDIFNPVIIGNWSPPLDLTFHVTAIEDYIYTISRTDDQEYVMGVDVSDPANPITVSVSQWWNTIKDLKILGDHCFILGRTGEQNRMTIVDISDRESPENVSTVFFEGDYPDALAVTDNYAYASYIYIDVGDHWWWDECDPYLCIIDISNPNDAEIIDNIEINRSKGLTVSGNYLYSECVTYGFEIFDISLPTSPERVGYYTRYRGIGWDKTEELVVHGEYVLVGSYFRIFDCSQALGDAQFPQPFNLISPNEADTSFSRDTLFTWYSTTDLNLADIPHYDVWIDTSSNLQTAWQVADSIPDTTLSVSGLPNITRCYWTVRATDRNTNGTWSSDTLSFYVNAPVNSPSPFHLLSPQEGDSAFWQDEVVFIWEESFDSDEGAELRYNLWLSTNANLDSALLIGEDVEDTTFSYLLEQGIYQNQTCYWTVHATDTNTPGTWSEDTLSFYSFDPADPPTQFHLLTPQGGDSIIWNQEVEFLWEQSLDPDEGAELRYNFWMSTSANLDTALLVGEDLEDSTFTYLFDQETYQNQTCFWTVHATDNNTDGTWAEDTLSFYIQYELTIDEGNVDEIPDKYSIVSAYPNPFNPHFTVVIGLPERDVLMVAMYNILGQKILTLINDTRNAGYHHLYVDTRNLSSGIYFIRAQVKGKMDDLRKVVLLR